MLEKLKIAQFAARKAKDVVQSALLTTVISDVQNIGKNGNREVTNDDVIGVLKKFVKSAEQNIETYTQYEKPDDLQKANLELELLKQFLPAQISKDEIVEFVQALIFSGNTKTGDIMKQLKQQYGTALNAKEAVTIINQLLS